MSFSSTDVRQSVRTFRSIRMMVTPVQSYLTWTNEPSAKRSFIWRFINALQCVNDTAVRVRLKIRVSASETFKHICDVAHAGQSGRPNHQLATNYQLPTTNYQLLYPRS